MLRNMCLFFYPQFMKSNLQHFSQPRGKMGSVSTTHLARVRGRTLGQPQARAACQAETNLNEVSVPYLCRGRPSPHGQDGVTQKSGVEGRVGGAWGHSVGGQPAVGQCRCTTAQEVLGTGSS